MGTEAGGGVSNVDGSEFDLTGGTICVGNDDLHPQLVKLLKAAG